MHVCVCVLVRAVCDCVCERCSIRSDMGDVVSSSDISQTAASGPMAGAALTKTMHGVVQAVSALLSSRPGAAYITLLIRQRERSSGAVVD
jgi:hypothetical protein